MTIFDLYRLHIKTLWQTRFLLRRYRVWSLDHVS
jgi:hypothetical protein